MEFRLLGPFEVESDGRDLTPSRPKRRALLAALVLRANEVVLADDLIEAVWAGSPPTSAQTALHGHVAALRKELGPERIETRPGGYLLRAEPAAIDARRFELLLETARSEREPAQRSVLFREALALFRGEPLADFRYEPFAREEAARLEQLRLSAVQDRIEAELELGRHAQFLPELEQLVAEHLYDERLRALLILALYRSGRQAQALQAYAEGRRRLVEELGIEPGPALQRLERQILNQDVALETASVSKRAGRPSSNLPYEPNRLIGRDTELAEIFERLDRTRLLTLTGPAGTGKTRLAIAAAAELAEAFPGGVVFVALAPIADSELVLPTIAHALGIRESGARALGDGLAHELSATDPLLVVLDNCEHVLAAAPALARLLAAIPALSLLATSREPLHLAGERVYPVPPLRSDEAIPLFVDRAQAIRPDFELTETNEPAVAEICRRLDMLPLAIELAASRVVLFPPMALLARLDQRLALLTGGGRDQPERHQTLRAAIDWSHELLSHSRQTLLARLSVFAGGWTLEGAEAVCNGDLDVVDGLASLIDKNLVRLEGAEEEPRFSMLETIREYALERFKVSGEVETRQRHAEYFLSFAERLEPELFGPNAQRSYALLLAELENFRLVLAWALESDAELGLRLLWALWRFWSQYGLEAESDKWCRAALAAAPDAPARLRGRGLLVSTDYIFSRGEWDKVEARLEEAIGLLEEAGDDRAVVWAMFLLSSAQHAQVRVVEAESTIRAVLARAEQHGYKDMIGRANSVLGIHALVAGDPTTAREHFEIAAVKFDEAGDLYSRGNTLGNLAAAAVIDDDLPCATLALAESLETWDPSSNPRQLGHVLVVAAATAVGQDDPEMAARLLGASRALFERLGFSLEPLEAGIERETQTLVQTELGAARYEEELARGADADPAEQLEVVKRSLQRWAGSKAV